MRLTNDTIDRIKQATDIVDVVGDYVSLKKRGSNYQACCPFHNEKTPSFNVNPARQIYKCFGCGAAGDSIKFVMDVDGIGYGEALRHLAGKYGIEVQEEQGTDEEMIRQNERESLFIVLNYAKDFFKTQLMDSEEGKAIGLSYFRERGFNNTTIQKFDLGYSPEAWDGLAKSATGKGYSLDILEKSGLVIRRDEGEGVYDRFRGRVIFPIHGLSGKVIGFGARTLKTDKKSPKYLNSPETEVYHKGSVLYGIAQAKASIRTRDFCYLVEGYTDVLSLHQAGIENVVASSGTALTIDQIRLVARFTNNITLLYDGDQAGIKAALRGLDLVLEEGLNVSIVTFPDNDDPDSYLRKVGAEEFTRHTQESVQDFITFKAKVLLKDAGNDPFKKAEVINEVVESIMKIPDAIKRQIFFRLTSDLLQVDEQTLILQGNKLVRQAKPKRDTPRDSSPAGMPDDLPPDLFLPPDEQGGEVVKVVSRSKSPLIYQEEAFSRLLILFGTIELEPGHTVCSYVLGQIEEIDFSHPDTSRILQEFRSGYSAGTVPETQHFIEHPDVRIREVTIDWTTDKYEVSNLWQEKFDIYIPTEIDLLDKSCFKFILRLKKAYLEERMKVYLEKLKSKDLSDDDLTATQMEYLRLKNIATMAARELGTVIG